MYRQTLLQKDFSLLRNKIVCLNSTRSFSMINYLDINITLTHFQELKIMNIFFFFKLLQFTK